MFALISPVLQPGWAETAAQGLTLSARCCSRLPRLMCPVCKSCKHKQSYLRGVGRGRASEAKVSTDVFLILGLSKGLWSAESSVVITLHCLVWGGISYPMKTSLTQTSVWHLRMFYLYFSITYVGIQALGRANYRVLNYSETILQCCYAIIQKNPS